MHSDLCICFSLGGTPSTAKRSVTPPQGVKDDCSRGIGSSHRVECREPAHLSGVRPSTPCIAEGLRKRFQEGGGCGIEGGGGGRRFYF